MTTTNNKKVFVLPANEDWIIDRFAREWREDNADITVDDPQKADVIWVLADFCWNRLPISVLSSRKVITSIHHIVPEKFDSNALAEFRQRDQVTTAYHIPNRYTANFITQYTQKPIHLIPYWANNKIWRPTGPMATLRSAHKLPKDSYIIGSFQRDTEGSSIADGSYKPKLEKGPDLFCDYVIKVSESRRMLGLKPVHVLLAGWRRQYVMQQLQNEGISFTYRELPDQHTLNELYQTCDLYAVTARCEGGPQALIECGLLNVPVVSTPVGIAEQVLPATAIAEPDKLIDAVPAVPNVQHLTLPRGYEAYRKMLLEL